MKKLLVASTALVAFAAVSSAQAADPVKLSIGGFMNQWVGYSDNEDDNNTADYSEVGTYSDAEIYFRGSTKLDNGLTVGVNIDTERSGAADGVSDDTFLSVSSDQLGMIKIGSTKGVSNGLSHIHGDVGLGLSDTDATSFVQDGLGLDLDTLTSSTDGHKAIYLTPNLGGFQAGVSYGLVNESNVGHADKRTTGNDIQYNAGLAYNGDFSGVSLGADINYEKIADGGITGVDTADEANIRYGLSVGVAGFTVVAAFQDVENNDNQAKADAQKWEAGVKYATGPYAVSLGYLNVKEDDNTTAATASSSKEDESQLWILSGSYDLGAGVTFAGSVFNLETDDASVTTVNSTADNDNWGVAAGLKVKF